MTFNCSDARAAAASARMCDDAFVRAYRPACQPWCKRVSKALLATARWSCRSRPTRTRPQRDARSSRPQNLPMRSLVHLLHDATMRHASLQLMRMHASSPTRTLQEIAVVSATSASKHPKKASRQRGIKLHKFASATMTFRCSDASCICASCLQERGAP